MTKLTSRTLFISSREGSQEAWASAAGMIGFVTSALQSVRPEEVEVLAADDQQMDYSPFVSLKYLFVSGAGVDQTLMSAGLDKVVVLRTIVAENISFMKEYVVYHVLRLHTQKIDNPDGPPAWGEPRYKHPASERSVGVFGMGDMGGAVASALSALGFVVRGWSRVKGRYGGIECQVGPDGFRHVLAESDIVVNCLPLTSQTRHLFGGDAFGWCRPGACFVNVGRGETVEEEQLLKAIDVGRISHAVLDVFQNEPLGPGSIFYHHSRVTVTPHIAAPLRAGTFIKAVCNKLAAIDRGEVPAGVVNKLEGY